MMLSPFMRAVRGGRGRTKVFTGYRESAGVQPDPWATTYNQATWSAANSGSGTVVLPTQAAPRITLNSGTTSGNFGRALHRAPFTFGGMTADDCIVLDLEFPAPGPEASDSITLIFSSDGYTAKSMQLGFSPTGRYVDGRIPMMFKMSEFGPASGEVFDGTTFNYMSIRYTKGPNSPGVNKQCIVHGLYVNPRARPKMMFEFDLGHAGVYNIAKDLFAARGIKGTVMITRAMIDTPGFMTTDQLQELYAMGWDMGVRNGPDHSTFADVASLTAEMQAARQWNVDRGLVRGSDHCIYPVGIMTANSRQALKNAGFKSARTTATGLVTTDVGVPDMYNFQTINLGGSNLYTYAKPFMDSARKYGKTCRMYTHEVANGGVAGGIATSDLALIGDDMKAFADAGAHDNCTITEWYDGLFTSAA